MKVLEQHSHRARARSLGLAWASVTLGLMACGGDSTPDAATPTDGAATDATDSSTLDGTTDARPPTDASDVPQPPTDMPPGDVPADGPAASARPDTVTRGATGSFVRPLDAAPTSSGATVFFIAFDTASRAPGVFRQNMSGMVSVVSQGDPLAAPTSLALSADDSRIFVADPEATPSGMGAQPEDGAILAMSAEGGAVSVIGLGTSVHHPRAIAVHGSADQITFVATADDGSAGVFRVGSAGGTPARLDMGAVLSNPGGLAVADDGTVYVLDTRGDGPNSAAIFRIAATGGMPTPVVARGLRAGFPSGIALSRDGARLLAAGQDPGNGPGALLWVRIDGTMAESPASFGPTSGLAFPCGLHRARNADVYGIADESASDTGQIFTAR